MKFYEDSINYQTVDIFFDEPSNSLCAYFWQSVASWLALVLIWITAASFIFVTYVVFVGVSEELTKSEWFTFFILPGVLAWAILGLSLVLIAMACVYNGIEYIIKECHQYQEAKEDGLIIHYLRAKKEKVCPRIEFVRSARG